MRRTALGALLLLAIVATALGQEPRGRKAPAERRPEEPRTPSRDARRAELLERARREIEKNPSQKKFILFRYGIDERDLR